MGVAALGSQKRDGISFPSSRCLACEERSAAPTGTTFLKGPGPRPKGTKRRFVRGAAPSRPPTQCAVQKFNTAPTMIRAVAASSSTLTHSSTAWATSMPCVPTITVGMPRAQKCRMSAP